MSNGGAEVGATATIARTRNSQPNTDDVHVLVIAAASATVVRLPVPGVALVGRGPEAEVHVDHPSVSRRHARFMVDSEGVRITDLDSHNGTRVNGEPLSGARTLVTGDVVSVGEILLVVHAELRPMRDLPLLDEHAWRRRLDEEVERAVGFRRHLAVLAIADAPSLARHQLRT
ncbi:MAG TPA: FHA domain-containing protein, partial [Kofleriaceae bacterium]|nr:FHA domain-containing protein [Kofleriaceae bacterium]